MDQDRPGWNPPAPGAEPLADVPMSAPTEISSGHRRSRVGTGVAVAAVGIGVLGLVGTAYAASGSPSPAPSSGSGAPQGELPGAPGAQGTAPGAPGVPDGDGDGPGRGGHMGGPGGMGGGMGMRLGMGGGIHGVFVTPKQGGGYQTVHTQRGTVTAVSSTSITVKSEDGYTKSYKVTESTVVNAQRDGIDSIETGDEVGIVGLEDGDLVTAVSIMDRTRIKDGLKPLAPPAPKATPTPGSTA
jgi:hypothetical protein